jgi:acyl-CoA synthetase (AMP-forming)/AMP-acid ligase II
MKASDLDPSSFDRTDFCPSHEGLTVLPHDIIFHRLLYLATNQHTVAIRELHTGQEIGYHQLLSDIIHERNYIRENLSDDTSQKLRRGEEVCILIVARGYAFVVAFFAVMALGAIAVPQSAHHSSPY